MLVMNTVFIIVTVISYATFLPFGMVAPWDRVRRQIGSRRAGMILLTVWSAVIAYCVVNITLLLVRG